MSAIKSESNKQFLESSFIERRAIDYVAKYLPTFQILSMTRIDGNDVFDVIIISGATGEKFGGIAEIKVKNCSIHQYKKYGAMILQRKFEDLIQVAKSTNSNPIYICIYLDGVAVWNLKPDKSPEWYLKDLKKTNNPNSPFVQKMTGNLSFDDCIEFKQFHVPVGDFREEAKQYFKNK